MDMDKMGFVFGMDELLKETIYLSIEPSDDRSLGSMDTQIVSLNRVNHHTGCSRGNRGKRARVGRGSYYEQTSTRQRSSTSSACLGIWGRKKLWHPQWMKSGGSALLPGG